MRFTDQNCVISRSGKIAKRSSVQSCSFYECQYEMFSNKTLLMSKICSKKDPTCTT